MPKPQKYKDVAKFLRSIGWEIQRQGKGSHEIWHDTNGTDRIPIPKHGEVSAGVVKQIVKKIPNTPDNWK